MHIFDNSEIKDVLNSIYTNNPDRVLKLCWQYIDLNESLEINCICEYIISLYNDKKNLKDILRRFSKCDNVNLVSELVRLIGALEFGKNEYYLKVAEETCSMVCELGRDIQKDFEEKYEKDVSSEVWMNGAILRGVALNLADFFYRKSDYEKELKMLGVRAVVTNSIMFDDLHFVGPTMVDYADCLIRLNRKDEAKKFYSVIVNDFKHFIGNYISNPLNLKEEDYFSIKSLRSSLEALIDNKERKNKIDNNVMKYEIMLKDVDLILNKSGYEENIQKK
ncbi:MAG: hypothetical protein ABF289_07020 [Clostridiales bacterium]